MRGTVQVVRACNYRVHTYEASAAVCAWLLFASVLRSMLMVCKTLTTVHKSVTHEYSKLQLARDAFHTRVLSLWYACAAVCKLYPSSLVGAMAEVPAGL